MSELKKTTLTTLEVAEMMFGIQLPVDFVKIPEYEQAEMDLRYIEN